MKGPWRRFPPARRGIRIWRRLWHMKVTGPHDPGTVECAPYRQLACAAGCGMPGTGPHDRSRANLQSRKGPRLGQRGFGSPPPGAQRLTKNWCFAQAMPTRSGGFLRELCRSSGTTGTQGPSGAGTLRGRRGGGKLRGPPMWRCGLQQHHATFPAVSAASCRKLDDSPPLLRFSSQNRINPGLPMLRLTVHGVEKSIPA